MINENANAIAQITLTGTLTRNFLVNAGKPGLTTVRTYSTSLPVPHVSLHDVDVGCALGLYPGVRLQPSHARGGADVVLGLQRPARTQPEVDNL